MKTLKGRLLLVSLLVLPLVLVAAGLTLDRAYQASLVAAEKSRLERYFYLLFSIAEIPAEGEGLRLPAHTAEPDFENTSSGILGFVFSAGGEIIWRSNSAALLPEVPAQEDFAKGFTPGQLDFHQRVFAGNDYFFAHYDTLWQMPDGRDIPFRFALMHNLSEYRQSLGAWRQQLWWGLAALTLGLLLLQVILLYWALRPLGRLAQALRDMRAGASSSLTGHYPAEIQQVADSLNAVLEREAGLRKRYRESLGNLAHSLKTPLAVLQSAIHKSPPDTFRHQAEEQLERINQVVSYQLQRAVSDHQSGSRQRTSLLACLERLRHSLDKIYAEKNIKLALDVDADVAFAGDEQDILELMGNLLDNAYKYGETQVWVSAELENDWLHITVDDDGPGIAETARETSFARGQRLDTSKPGQGIGLAVCADITASYKGKLRITRSPLKGARFILALPGVRLTSDV